MRNLGQPEYFAKTLIAAAADRLQFFPALANEDQSFYVEKIMGYGTTKRSFALPRRQCILLDAAAENVTVSDVAALRLVQLDFAIGFWVKTAASGVSVADLLMYREAGNGEGYSFDITAAGKITFDMEGHGATEKTITSTTAINDGRWHHVAVTCDRSSTTGLNIYIDGAADATAVDASALVADNISPAGVDFIIAGDDSKSLYLSSVGLYTAADLSATLATIVAQMYNGGRGYKFLGTETSLVWAINMDEGSVSAVCHDMVSTNDGAITSATYADDDPLPDGRGPAEQQQALAELGPFGFIADDTKIIEFANPQKIGKSNPLVLYVSGAGNFTIDGFIDKA